VRDIQVLCPMNRGGLGARSLNIELQKILNPPGEIRIERFGWTFCPGDKVMQIENDYDREVYNGDLGIVSRIDMEDREITVDFEGREVVYGFGELDELVLAYATTIHKSQGRRPRSARRSSCDRRRNPRRQALASLTGAVRMAADGLLATPSAPRVLPSIAMAPFTK
jgi:hypothetical protein